MASHNERYGPAHRRLRASLREAVESGTVLCARCGIAIGPDEEWDLGHIDGETSEYAGPEHRACNRSTTTHARQAQTDRTSRVW